MRDAVLHESNQISFFGLRTVNPALISGMVVTAVLLIAATCIRIFAVPKFRYVPGRFQMLLEQAVGMFDGMAKSNSPWRNSFLGSLHLCRCGATSSLGRCLSCSASRCISHRGGSSIALPAPLSGCERGDHAGRALLPVSSSPAQLPETASGESASALKEVSLPISMSFRLFGALLSGLLVTELVYYYVNLSFVLPVVVGVLFTLLHALIQSYVLTMLTALFYGEMSEPAAKAKAWQKSGRAKARSG